MPFSLAWIGTWVINPMLGIIMFGMGLTLSANDLKIVLSSASGITSAAPSSAREFREREDYISYAEHELRCFFPFRGMPSRYFVL